MRIVGRLVNYCQLIPKPMKKDKICISKAVALMIPVTIVLITIILFTNYLNQQSYSTKSKAMEPSKSAMSNDRWCTFQRAIVTVEKPTNDTDFNYYYNPKTFCIISIYDGMRPRGEQPIPYKCKSSETQILIPGEAEQSNTCSGGVGVCMYGGKALLPGIPVWNGSQKFAVDGMGCITQDGKTNGWRCNVGEDYGNIIDTENCPDKITRDVCLFGGKDLVQNVPLRLGSQTFTIDAIGCIKLDGTNNGLICTQETNWVGIKAPEGMCPILPKKILLPIVQTGKN